MIKYVGEISALFEAVNYLDSRFCGKRVTDKLEEMNNRTGETHKYDLASFECIARLESELDKEFVEDELMRQYFSPLSFKDDENIDPISIGAILLSFPADMDGAESVDELIEHYAKSSLNNNLTEFLAVLQSSSSEIVNLQEVDMQTFVSKVDCLLTFPSEKWTLINAASDPCTHLRKLKPLITEIQHAIESRMDMFKHLLADSERSFVAFGDFNARLIEMNIIIENDHDTIVKPSLFLFNGIRLHLGAEGANSLFMGVFIDSIFEMRSRLVDAESYLSMLKTLADGTRLRVLKSLYNRYSYGQELADELGGTRNAMYYHIEKLMSIGLVDCKVTEYKMLYTMNKLNVYNQLTAFRVALLQGWKPDDEERG